MSRPTISFEFFPPKTDKAAEILWASVPELVAMKPRFMTCTYGAGGSTKDGTVETVTRMAMETGIPVAAHLTFINTTKTAMYAFVDQLWDKGVRHIIALRGDMPPDLDWPLNPDGDYFQYTSDFVEGLKAQHDFEISVSAYPEKHPDAPSLDSDIEALKKKCDAGADRAITQFFFNNDSYYAFLEKADAAGIKTPIVPGILPIYDFKSMCGFATKCQTAVPDWLKEKYGTTPEADHLKLSEEILTEQCRDLMEHGVSHFHFYTLNRSLLLVPTCKALGLDIK